MSLLKNGDPVYHEDFMAQIAKSVDVKLYYLKLERRQQGPFVSLKSRMLPPKKNLNFMAMSFAMEGWHNASKESDELHN